MYCSSCGSKIPDGRNYCSVCGNYMNGTQDNSQSNSMGNTMNHEYIQQYNQPLGMKWYKFNIYFWLFLCAIMNVIGGFGVMTGSMYVSNGTNLSDYIYRLYGGLKGVDVLMGIVCIVLGVYCLVVRAKLAEFKEEGPKFFIAIYIIDLIITFVHPLLVSMVTPFGMFEFIDFKDVLFDILFIALNKIYFDKRMHLFVY